MAESDEGQDGFELLSQISQDEGVPAGVITIVPLGEVSGESVKKNDSTSAGQDGQTVSVVVPVADSDESSKQVQQVPLGVVIAEMGPGTPSQPGEYEPGSKKCNICGRILSSVQSCLNHIENHKKPDFTLMVCEVCGWAFESTMQRNMHRKTHGSGAAKKEEKKTEEKRTELENKGGGVKLSATACLFCGRVFDVRDDLKAHQEKHCADFNFLQCPDCEMCFETESPLKAHRKQSHKRSSEPAQRMYEPYLSFTCTICQRAFKTEGKFEEHVSHHSSGVAMFKCTDCGWCFETKRDLGIHKQNKHKESAANKHAGYKLPCDVCRRLFKTEGDMQNHLENHYNGKKLHVCPECGFAYENVSSMHAHKYDKHVKPLGDKTPRTKKTDDPEVIARTCSVCQRILASEAEKEAHLVNHDSQIPMSKCDVCSWEFESQEKYCEHVEMGHKKKGVDGGPHLCDTCGRKFNSEKAQFSHIQNHLNDVDMFKCDFCPFEFESFEQCTRHSQKCGKSASSKKTKSVNKEKYWRYKCDFCDRKFQNETIKAVHMQNHLSNAPMTKCTQCAAMFEQDEELEYHMKNHKLKETPKKESKDPQDIVCSQCDRQFYFEHQMKTHRENHFNGTELFKCRHCPWEFEKESSLANHVKQYHPFYAPTNELAQTKKSSGMKYPCVLCKRVFTVLIAYVQHLVNHQDVPFICPFEACGWAFEDFKQFQKHKQSKHNEKYRLEKLAEERTQGNELTKVEQKIISYNPTPEQSVNFSLTCPRCREEFKEKKKMQSHASRCKVAYTCKLCDLQFVTFYEFEYHIYPEEMECEVCKKMFASECVLQTHLVEKHFSAEMLEEDQKQQSMVEEAEKLAKESAKRTIKKEKVEPEATVSKAPDSEPEETKAPPAATKKKAPAKKKPEPKEEVAPVRSSRRRSKATATSPETKNQEGSETDTTSDEHLVSSTVDTPDVLIVGVSSKRKRAGSPDSNFVNSSDDAEASKRKKETKSEDKVDEGEDEGYVCDVQYCNGTFFENNIYMEHVRHVHSDITNITSDEKCTTIMIKDASRTTPTQRGPASKRKEYTVLRIQCTQGPCEQSVDSYFPTKALYNKHVAATHSSVAKDTGADKNKETSKRDKSPAKSDDKSETGNENSRKRPSRSSGKKQETDEATVQSTVSSDDDEKPSKKKKLNEGEELDLISDASYTTLLKDLESLNKAQEDPKKTTATKKSPSRVSPRRK